MNTSDVTIITLNYNGLKDTQKFIKSIFTTKYSNYKVVVLDNGSKVNEALLLSTEHKKRNLKIIRLNKNYGYSGGNNRAMINCGSKYIALVNNDVIVTRNWLQPLIETMEADKSIAMVQPKILWLKNKKYFDYAGACGGFIDNLGYPFTRGRIFNTQEKDDHQYDDTRDIFWASGAAIIIRNSVLKEVGYFDELFFNYMEEIDLCFRILQRGYRIVSVPSSIVYHKVASTSSQNMMKKRFWEHRNNLILIMKHFSFSKLVFILPLRILMEYISIFYYLALRRIDLALGALLGQLSLFLLFPKIIYGRIINRNLIRDNAQLKKLMFKGSIVVSYFILRKKTFSELLLPADTLP